MWGTFGLQEKEALVSTQDQLTLAINRLREQEAEAAVHKVSCQAKQTHAVFEHLLAPGQAGCMSRARGRRAVARHQCCANRSLAASWFCRFAKLMLSGNEVTCAHMPCTLAGKHVQTGPLCPCSDYSLSKAVASSALRLRCTHTFALQVVMLSCRRSWRA